MRQDFIAALLRLIADGRKCVVGSECGAVFEDDSHFDGLTLTIELTEEEADELDAILGTGHPPVMITTQPPPEESL